MAILTVLFCLMERLIIITMAICRELLDDDYTYSMWIKPLETTLVKPWFFVFGENGTASHIGFFQDKLRIGTWGTDGLDTGYAGFSEWKHVLVTFDKTSNTHTLYVNGQLGPFLELEHHLLYQPISK